MLVRFKVSNFLSFNSEQELCMFPSRVLSLPEHKFKTKTTQVDILKSAIIYGANSSGKTNLVKAIDFAKTFIVNGSSNRSYIDVPQFGFTNPVNAPSRFVFEIHVDGRNYEYGFEITKSVITREWLSRVSKVSEEVLLFTRTIKDSVPMISYASRFSGDIRTTLEVTKKEIKNNQLFITILNSKNTEVIDKEIRNVFNWFDSTLHIIFPYSRYAGIQLGILKSYEIRDAFNHFLKEFDTGIEELDFIKYNLDDKRVDIPDFLKDKARNELDEKNKALTLTSRNGHERYCIEREDNAVVAHKLIPRHLLSGQLVDSGFDKESDGTNRIFDLIPVLLMMKNSNKVVIFDEIDRSLHSLIPEKFFDFFFQLVENKPSQLIATTHDLNLLDLTKFRRDEIWFMRKNYNSESELYSLEEFKIRSDKNLINDYKQGLYKAIPIFSRTNHASL